MAKIADQVICTELMEDPCVKYAHDHVIDSDVASLKHEETVLHHSEPHIALAVTSIGELVFIQQDLPILLDWIVLSKHVHR